MESHHHFPELLRCVNRTPESRVIAPILCAREEALRHAVPLTASSKGTMFGFFFHPGPVHNFQQAKESNLNNFKAFFNLMLNEGVYFAPSQFEAGFVSIAHRGAPLEHTVSAIRKVFGELVEFYCPKNLIF